MRLALLECVNSMLNRHGRRREAKLNETRERRIARTKMRETKTRNFSDMRGERLSLLDWIDDNSVELLLLGAALLGILVVIGIGYGIYRLLIFIF